MTGLYVYIFLVLLVILVTESANCVESECEANLGETIDLHAFIKGNKTVKDQIAKQFDIAMSNLGFLFLSNHGVNTDTIQSLYNGSKAFFHSSSEEKSKYIVGKYLGSNGYHPFGFEKLDKSQTEHGADLVENYYICNKGYNWYLSDPSWSDIPKQFILNVDNININIMKQYVLELRALLYRVHTLAIYALNMERNYFEEYLIDDVMDNNNFGQFCLRLNYYFALNQSQMDIDMNMSMRLGAHSDFRSFTLLYVDEIKGLQTKIDKGNNNMEWINVNHKKNTFILNAGYFLELWTMNKWKAPIHRVSAVTNKERISMIYFTGPRGNVIIEPFPDCIDCKKTAQQYLTAKYQNAHYD